MSPFIAYHATSRRHRDSIRERGLIPSAPLYQLQWGVYVFRDDYSHPLRLRQRATYTVWGWYPPQDLWQVAYIGPMSPDQYVANALVLHTSVPPQHLTLITQLTPSTDDPIRTAA